MLTYSDLFDACSPGGASVLTAVTELGAAAGDHASVAPAKFVRGNRSVFDFQTRFIDGTPQRVVTIDSKQSMLNRAEAALRADMLDGDPVISRIPRIEVSYGEDRYSDLDLPHRAFDGHIRAGTIDGVPATESDTYRAVRDSGPGDSSAALGTAPAFLVFGGWDASRKSHQVRRRSALVGEIIGVLADQDAPDEEQIGMRGGARVDPVGMSVQLDAAGMQEVLEPQIHELSPKLVEDIESKIKKAKKGTALSGANLGLGGIPPALETIGGVSCRRIIRSWVLSFATLRQLRFGADPEGDAAGRALLAALAFAGMTRADRELYLRANCDLVEKGAPALTLDERHGRSRDLGELDVAAADALLEEAIERAAEATGVDWSGQVLDVAGNPRIIEGAAAEDEDE